MNRVKEVIEIGQGGEVKSPSQIRRERTEKMLEHLERLECFGREEMLEIFKVESPELSEAAFKYRLQKLLKDGRIERIGRNKYCICRNKKMEYEPNYSKDAKTLALRIVENFAYIEFRIFEPTQVAKIIKDGYDSNILFVSIDNAFLDMAMEKLSRIYQNMVLVKPDDEEFNGKIMYEKEDGWIVLNPLVSESPRGRNRLWHTDLEKLLVDMVLDKVLRSLWSNSQIAKLYEIAFEKYYVDESKLLRYARRRRGVTKIAEFLRENTEISLKTV